jgi:uncharacterized membrane protein YczE
MINVILARVGHQDAMRVRVPFMIVGIVLIAVGICFGISTRLGPGPSEVFMLGLVHHRVGVVVARWISDLLPVVIGFSMGGALGVGTVGFLVTMGPLVKVGLRLLRFDTQQQEAEPAGVGA